MRGRRHGTLAAMTAPGAAALQVGRPLVAATALALLWTIESVAPMYVGRRRRLSHGAANLGLAALNAAVAYAFAILVVGATEWSRATGFGLLTRAPLPAWLHGALALVLLDCWQYWWHRANHRLPFLWRFHAVHHADAELDVTSGVRFHTIEITLSFLARLVVLPVLGVTATELVLYDAITLPIILFHHANLAMPERPDRLLRALIVTPRMHYVHHSRLRAETDSNYASGLTVWDRVFGSYRRRDDPRAIVLGLDDWPERAWRTLAGMLRAPFRRTAARPVRRD
jgi:sterol desaturase/sphingolipid hydroxylase (fatty acid hydroxylase superfamily)